MRNPAFAPLAYQPVSRAPVLVHLCKSPEAENVLCPKTLRNRKDRGVTGPRNISNRHLEDAKLYHLNRAEEEASRARTASDAGARSSHEGLSALHTEASRRLNEIATIRAEIRDRLG